MLVVHMQEREVSTSFPCLTKPLFNILFLFFLSHIFLRDETCQCGSGWVETYKLRVNSTRHATGHVGQAGLNRIRCGSTRPDMQQCGFWIFDLFQILVRFRLEFNTDPTSQPGPNWSDPTCLPPLFIKRSILYGSEISIHPWAFNRIHKKSFSNELH